MAIDDKVGNDDNKLGDGNDKVGNDDVRDKMHESSTGKIQRDEKNYRLCGSKQVPWRGKKFDSNLGNYLNKQDRDKKY